jgi:hypothetical protein
MPLFELMAKRQAKHLLNFTLWFAKQATPLLQDCNETHGPPDFSGDLFCPAAAALVQ